MRFLELFEQLLLEHNVVNTKDISDYVEQFASTCRNENAADWFRHTLARHLERDDQVNVKLNDTNIPRNAPAWLDSAVARGDDLRVFQPPFHMNTDFEHLADYFNFLDERSDPVVQNRDRLLKVTVDAAVKRANDWTAAASKSAMKTEVKDVEEVFRDGTFRWVEPKSFEAYTRDGAILGHCTAQGTYDTEFRSGSMKFYFLHDAKGQPHVCLSVMKGGGLDQVKGKQNQPPVGRYIQLCANFLNHLHIADAAENYDVMRMGLKVNGEGKLSTASAMGVLVHKIGGVRIYKTEAAAFSIEQRGGYYDNRSKRIAGGHDYWLNSSDGDLFRINISDEGGGRAYVNGFACDAQQARNLTQQFLNSDFFPDGAPQPLETQAHGASKNDITYEFHLSYDYLSKRYGTVQEVSEKKLELEGGYTGYVRGKSQYGKVKPELVLYGPESEVEPVVQLELGESLGGPSYGTAADRDLLIKLYNRLALPPSDEYRQSRWRKPLHIFYNTDSGKWGGIEVCPKLWTKAGYSLHHRKENEDQEAFMMVKDGEQEAIYEFGHGTNEYFRIILSEDAEDNDKPLDKKLITKTLLGVLNKCPELQWLRESKQGKLDTYNVFFANGKWQSRESAGETMHKFDDGAYITSIPRVGSQVTYSIYGSDDKLICALTLDTSVRSGGSSALIDHHVFSDDKIRASRYILWLFNNLEVPAVDLVDGDHGYNASATPRHFLWQMGLFHDTRSDEWKLVQDGKLVYDGDGYRAVNFRNRIFIIDNGDGCVGWFKKGDSSTPLHIVTDPHVFPPATLSDFYGYLADLCRNTDFEMPVVTSAHQHEDTRRKHGYAHGPDGQFDAIENFHPTETVLDLPKGYKWIRKASDPTFYDFEKEEKLHHNRYSLADKKGKTFMRVETDNGYVAKVTFSSRDTFESYHLTNDLGDMKDGPQKKFFLQLLEKLQVKLTPTQAAAIQYYRTKSGSYKPLGGHPMLEAYMKGQIDFGDGHIFKRDRHYDSDRKEHLTKWELGIVDETEEHTYNQWKPYIRVVLDDDGIDSVKYLKKDVKRQPSQYMPYIQKLMKIFTTLAGE